MHTFGRPHGAQTVIPFAVHTPNGGHTARPGVAVQRQPAVVRAASRRIERIAPVQPVVARLPGLGRRTVFIDRSLRV